MNSPISPYGPLNPLTLKSPQRLNRRLYILHLHLIRNLTCRTEGPCEIACPFEFYLRIDDRIYCLHLFKHVLSDKNNKFSCLTSPSSYVLDESSAVPWVGTIQSLHVGWTIPSDCLVTICISHCFPYPTTVQYIKLNG